MPIEIRELHIKVSVTNPEVSQARNSSSASGTGNAGSGNNREEIVAECVEKVLEILQNKNER